MHLPTISELERRYAAMAAEVRRLGLELEDKGRGPSWLWLPRVPAGNGRESGRWTTPGGVIGSWRGGITRDQQQRLEASAERAPSSRACGSSSPTGSRLRAA
jgi:hypothetical protein